VAAPPTDAGNRNASPSKTDWEEVNRPYVNLLNEGAQREERSHLLGKVTEYLVVSIFVMTLVAHEWAHWYFKWTPQPMVFAVLGVPLVGYALVRVWFLLTRLHHLRVQQNASRSLKSAIESLSEKGWYVFHNVRDTTGWNVGSVIVGPGGAFTVTARFATRRGEAGETVDHLDRHTLRLADHEALADPLGQARRSAFALYGLLSSANLDTVPVQPILVFPGWPLGRRPPQEERDVWVANEQSLAGEFSDLPKVLEPRDLIGICTVLERHAKP